MSVQALRLRNFRGFRDATLELKPLTILLGPNSSGKSSFGHALAAASHCQRRDAGSQRASLSPHGNPDEWPVDLGTLETLRTQNESDRVYIGFRTEGGWVELGFGNPDDGKSPLELSSILHPFGLPTTSVVVPLDSAKLSVPSGHTQLSRLNQGTWWDQSRGQQTGLELDGLLIRSMQPFSQTSVAPPGEPQETLRLLFSTLAYLRGTRKRPSRFYDDELGRWQEIGYAGEWTAALLHRRGADPVTFALPPRIPSSVEEAKLALDRHWLMSGQIPLGKAIGNWLLELGLAKSVEVVVSADNRRLRVMVRPPGQEARDIADVGFGVSQVLPVLAAGLLQPPGSLFVVDLPEAHLHPWPQARLADFFCNMALSGRSALIETHSEMFFHWLRLRAEMNHELLAMIAVYFLDEPKNGECSLPRLVGLTSKEQLRWPTGFLGEAWNAEKHIKVLRQARGRLG